MRTNRNNTTTTYSYNVNNWVTSIEHSNSLGRIVGFGYVYDNEGNKLYEEKRHNPTSSEAYQYDVLDRLVDYRTGTLVGPTVPAPVIAKTWNLDPVGNWNNVTSNGIPEVRVHNTANELTSINTTNVLSYDDNGNLQQDPAYIYSYDEENRLTKVQRISDFAVVGQYSYDALSRRVVKIANPAGLSSTNLFFYDEASIIEEQNIGGGTLATYTYGNYLDEVLTMDRGGQTFYYHQNALWSPHALSQSSGAVAERYSYDAYGGVVVMDASYAPLALNAWGTPHSIIGNPNLFTGRQLDEETGLYFYRARFYDSVKGRFLQRDPLEYVDGMNLYGYARNNPITFADPLGLVGAVREWSLVIEGLARDVATEVGPGLRQGALQTGRAAMQRASIIGLGLTISSFAISGLEAVGWFEYNPENKNPKYTFMGPETCPPNKNRTEVRVEHYKRWGEARLYGILWGLGGRVKKARFYQVNSVTVYYDCCCVAGTTRHVKEEKDFIPVSREYLGGFTGSFEGTLFVVKTTYTRECDGRIFIPPGK